MFTLTSARQTVRLAGGSLTVSCSATGAEYVLELTEPAAAVSMTEDNGRIDFLGSLRAELSMKDGCLCITVTGHMEEHTGVRHPFSAVPNLSDRLLIPLGEGVCLPVEDSCELLCGRRLFDSRDNSMSFIALLRGDSWLLTVVEDGSDAASETYRDSCGLLRSDILWLPEMGAWGYARTVRYLTGSGGITGACKAYRKLMDKRGLLITLEEKTRKLPHLWKILSAADVWLWHDNYEKLMYSDQVVDEDINIRADIRRIASEMKKLGVRNAIWGIFFEKDGGAVPYLKEELGYLTSKYDNYTDLPPADMRRFIPKNRIDACDYTYRRLKDWPDGAATDKDGTPLPAWELRGTDGKMHPQSKLCPRVIAERMAEEIPEEITKVPYDCRFIDVLGVEAYECRSKEHPVSRREFARLRRVALAELGDLGLLAGTEDGSESAVPALCYNEGMMSPVYFRYNYLQAGRNKACSYCEDARRFFESFMLSPRYRVPLWELVFHDCVVSYWYWGDSTNCCPEVIADRDLLNILYGTPPLYSFRVGDWERLRPLIAASYARVGSAAEITGGREMRSFDYLTNDKLIQRTIFDGGVSVIVNLSDQTFDCGDRRIPPRDYAVIQEGDV